MNNLPCSYFIFQASNGGALSLYKRLGFVKEEKLARYYLNGGDAYRLKLWIDKVSNDVKGKSTERE